MKAEPFRIGQIFQDAKRFVVPIYQRTYAWKIEPHLETFFDQVAAKAEQNLRGSQFLPHYMGATLLIPRGTFSFGKMPVFDVVDGQQRITTFQIFLAGLRELARSMGETRLADLISPLLVNPEGPQIGDPSERYKLWPTEYDRELYCDLVNLDIDSIRRRYGTQFRPNGKTNNIAVPLLKAYVFLRSEAYDFIGEAEHHARVDRLRALSASLLEGFQSIVITLAEDDDAQVIFETLNAGGEPLAAMDLVRNDVFLRAERSKEDVEQLMARRWRLFEDPFWKALGTRGRIKKPRIDFFLSDYLAAQTGNETLLTELFSRYKRFVKDYKFGTVDAELETLLAYAPTFHSLVAPSEGSSLSYIARELGVFDVTTAYPLIFIVAASEASEDEKARIFRLIVSYVVRRMVCGLTAKAYNNVFLRIISDLKDTTVSYDSTCRAFACLDSVTTRFPNNDEFKAAIISRKQYGSMAQSRLQHLLACLEEAMLDKNDETLTVKGDLTIEHVLPDSWTEHWILDDGSRASSDFFTGMNETQLKLIGEREALKHSLGNLTLLTSSRNPSLGNLDFDLKRAKFGESRLKMNREIAKSMTWGTEQIRSRGIRLAELATSTWPGLA